MGRYIPSKSNLQTGGSTGNSLLGTLTVLGFSTTIFMVGLFWLKDMGGANALADAVEHATGTYDWMHTNPHQETMKQWMDRMMPPSTSHVLPQGQPIEGFDTPWHNDQYFQGTHSPANNVFHHPEEWNLDSKALNDAMDRAAGAATNHATCSIAIKPTTEAIISDPAYLMAATEKGLKVVWKAIEHGWYHIY